MGLGVASERRTRAEKEDVHISGKDGASEFTETKKGWALCMISKQHTTALAKDSGRVVSSGVALRAEPILASR